MKTSGASPLPLCVPISRLHVFIAASVLLALMSACRNRTTLRELRNTAASPRITAIESRVDVVLGRTLVMPVVLEGAIKPSRAIKAKLDDGRTLPVSLYWISVAAQPNAAPSWLPDPGKWTATPAAADSRPAGTGSWAIVANLPTDAIGQGMWLGRHRTALNWLPSPGFVKSRNGAIDWSSPLDTTAASPSLTAMSAPEARSPNRRWRHRLMVGGLAPHDDPLIEAAAAPDTFPDPVIEAFAHQIEGRWQVALATLWMADPYVAGIVKRRLANVVDFGDGTVVPAWPVGGADLDGLLVDLLNARLQPGQQVDRARAWLETQPPAVAWVIDDAGQRDAQSGHTVATIGVANLSERDTLGWTAAASPDLVPVPGFTAVTITAAGGSVSETSPPRTRPTSPATDVEINVGKWPSTRPIMLDAMPALPPGIRLEPFRREWDLPTWLSSGAPQPVEEGWTAAGMLYHDASEGSWNVFIECRSPALGTEETVRVWLGGFGAPASIIRVTSSGTVTDERAPRLGLSAKVEAATVSRQGDTWTARIPIPPRCIEQDGTLRIGLGRTDALGRGTSWPRPMLPWQVEPGRISVDTSAWSRLGSGGGLSSPAAKTSPATPSSSTR